ncbi:S-layer homology domain-containing protein [Paenibacillus eucommiae]|uniref:SLH domain-containing protein n=1 Tax=Paenibacillus eucommiae TaxID=1355755 RepID=A0ABS4JAW5_9BACL|nr:S-layer homology domain-containing protein [Paenibacillus eucommiae]MBP1996987.1 hypothetical protein [Paenibacillus eucommiae]
MHRKIILFIVMLALVVPATANASISGSANASVSANANKSMSASSSTSTSTSTNAEISPSFEWTAGKPADGKVILTMRGKSIKDLYAFEARFTFDPGYLDLVEAKASMEGFSVSPIVNQNEITFAHTKIGNVNGESGDMIIGTLTFKLKKQGNSTVRWESLKALDHNLSNQTYTIGKSVTVDAKLLPRKVFLDLEGHWAKEDIELLASKGIIEGMDDEHFVPEARITRAQFAALIARALDLKAGGTARSPFTDVAQGSWYEDAVNSAYSVAIIQGKTNISFAPAAPITREEMAVMLMRAKLHSSGATSASVSVSVEKQPTTIVLEFHDIGSISDWAMKDVELAVRLGIMNGRADTKFVPQGLATRAEAAVVLKRLLAGLTTSL